MYMYVGLSVFVSVYTLHVCVCSCVVCLSACVFVKITQNLFTFSIYNKHLSFCHLVGLSFQIIWRITNLSYFAFPIKNQKFQCNHSFHSISLLYSQSWDHLIRYSNSSRRKWSKLYKAYNYASKWSEGMDTKIYS